MTGVPQLVAAGGRAPVLPHDRVVQRRARAPRPRHDGLALVGDADGRDRFAQRRHQLREHVDHGRPDLARIVFDPARSGEVLRELAVRPARRSSMVVDGEGPHSGRTRIDGDDHGHGSELYGSVEGMKVGMLTGGGDCPGLNAVLRAAVRKAEVVYHDELVGFRDGWRGVVENMTTELDVERMRGTLPRGGTVLGSSRTNPYKVEGGVDGVKATLAESGVDALIAVGGEDTLCSASRLHGDGVAVVGVPKTIDTAVSATGLTFGFDTGVQV